MSAHAKLPLSGSSRWGKCTNWLKMQELAPLELVNRAHPVTLEGNAAHDLCAMMLTHGLKPMESHIGLKIKGVAITREMWRDCEFYARDIFSISKTDLHIEERVSAAVIHSSLFGTADCWYYDTATKTLYLWDFKYGYTIVDAVGNTQLAAYAASIMDNLGLIDTETNLVLTIIQPRAYKLNLIDRWELKGHGLRKIINQLKNAAQENIHGLGVNCVGDWCKYCNARLHCGDFNNYVENLRFTIERRGLVNLNDTDLPEYYGRVKELKEKSEWLLNGVSQIVESKLMKGGKVGNYALEPKRGRRNWAFDKDVIKNAANLMGVDISDNKILTPYQAQLKGLDINVINQFTKTESYGFNIVEKEYSREREIFKNVTTTRS